MVDLRLGDCREVLKELADNSIDSIVCDPPYELGFMGKKWDSTGIAYDLAVWKECLRVLKPGGHLLAAGGTRTHHRLMVAIEDAGFEIRDCIMWLYGSGFPKSHNLHDEWHGWGTALKPAWEPFILARKPLSGTVADTVLTHGTGALNIDGCRVEASIEDIETQRKRTGGVMGASIGDKVYEGGWKRQIAGNPSGRWPANVLLDEGSAEMLDAQSGVSRSSATSNRNGNNKQGVTGMIAPRKENMMRGHSDSGGASRFFYVAKASASERSAGMGDMVNVHPTVKPITLMRYLVRLITPPDGTVLDPFMGSGSTGCAAVLEGMQFVGIDITPEYVEIAKRRIAHWQTKNPLKL